MKTIRIGIFGTRRGDSYVKNILMNNGEVVALCDKDEKYLKKSQEKLGGDVAVYTDFDEFIKHPMDACLIANYFHEHSEYAIRCLEKNINVLCECTSNSTMAEGVKLVRASEKSKAIFMLAENYPFMLFNQEIKKVYEGGTLGKVLYAEGEYNHPTNLYNTDDLSLFFDSEKHWRLFLPKTYYITHSLAPLMYATGSRPVKVVAMPVFAPEPKDTPRAGNVGDVAAVMLITNDDNSVFKVTGHSTFGAEENSYRIMGKRGQIENMRGNADTIILNYNDWEVPEGKSHHNTYKVEIDEENVEFIKKAGHGGGDYFVVKKFFECIREGKSPEMDVYFATKLASVAILAHRSILNGSMPYDIPDFRREEDRKQFENDKDSPFWYSDGRAPTIACCSRPEFKPTEEQIKKFKKALKEDYDNK